MLDLLCLVFALKPFPTGYIINPNATDQGVHVVRLDKPGVVCVHFDAATGTLSLTLSVKGQPDTTKAVRIPFQVYGPLYVGCGTTPVALFIGDPESIRKPTVEILSSS